MLGVSTAAAVSVAASSAIAATKPAVKIEAGLTRLPSLDFYFLPGGTVGDEPTPVIRQVTISRSLRGRLGIPAAPTSLGMLAFDQGADAGRHRQVILRVDAKTPSGYVIGRGAGVKVVLRPRDRRFISFTLPSGARNPHLRFNKTGTRLLISTTCRTLRFTAKARRADGSIEPSASTIDRRALKRARLCS